MSLRIGHDKKPQGKIIFRKLLSIVTGYAHHPECGQKIYRPYKVNMPGKCGKCGADIHSPCRKETFEY